MQQNVVAPVAVTMPIGCPSMAVQLPPCGGTRTVALAELMLGFPLSAMHLPEAAVATSVWQLGVDAASEYNVHWTEQVSPVDAPQVHAEQSRVSFVPE